MCCKICNQRFKNRLRRTGRRLARFSTTRGHERHYTFALKGIARSKSGFASTMSAPDRVSDVELSGKPVDPVKTSMMHVILCLLKGNELLRVQVKETETIRAQMQDLAAENRVLRMNLFVKECSIPLLLQLFADMNVYDHFYLVRVCYCHDCLQLTPFAQVKSRQKCECQVFPFFQQVCTKYKLKLVVLAASDGDALEPPKTFMVQDSLCYTEDAHFVIQGPNNWKTLGYGTRVTEAETFHGDQMDGIRHLFNDVRRCRAQVSQEGP